MSESVGIDSPVGGRTMPQSYSGDLRERVIGTVEAGSSRREAADLFEISVSSAIRWVKRWREEGSSEPKPRGAAVLSWTSTRIGSLLSWPSTKIGLWMKYSLLCTSSGFRAAELRSGDFSIAMISPLKKKPMCSRATSKRRSASAATLDSAARVP